MNRLGEEIFKDKDCALFDLDGTLVDSMWMWHSIDIEYLGRFGIPYETGLQQGIEGMSFSETAVFFKEHFHIEDSLEKIKSDWNEMAIYKYGHEVLAKPGVIRLLQELKERGIKIGIATSNSMVLVSEVLKAQKIDQYIDCVVTACEVAKGKPNPDVYLEAARRLGANPQKCIVFEDIVPGIMAGKNAGMHTVAVADEYSEQSAEEKKEAADYFIDSYLEMFDRS